MTRLNSWKHLLAALLPFRSFAALPCAAAPYVSATCSMPVDRSSLCCEDCLALLRLPTRTRSIQKYLQSIVRILTVSFLNSRAVAGNCKMGGADGRGIQVQQRNPRIHTSECISPGSFCARCTCLVHPLIYVGKIAPAPMRWTGLGEIIHHNQYEQPAVVLLYS
jgi:hypothetical protein